MDRIVVEGLEVETIIGVHDWEQQRRQKVVIDVTLFSDTGRAALSDDLSDTVSYGDVARSVTTLVEESHFKLIESLAEKIAAALLDEFRVSRLVVTVGKPDAVANAATVRVTIERSR